MLNRKLPLRTNWIEMGQWGIADEPKVGIQSIKPIGTVPPRTRPLVEINEPFLHS
jgi:hypothetical protein